MSRKDAQQYVASLEARKAEIEQIIAKIQADLPDYGLRKYASMATDELPLGETPARFREYVCDALEGAIGEIEGAIEKLLDNADDAPSGPCHKSSQRFQDSRYGAAA